VTAPPPQPDIPPVADADPFRRALRLAARLFGAAAAWVPSASTAPIRVHGEADTETLRTLAARAAAVGVGYVVEDAAAYPGFRAAAAGIGFAAAVPTPPGVLVVVGRTPRRVDTDEMAALADLALLAAEAVPRSSDAEFEGIFAGAPDAIMFAGPDRRLRRVNSAACRLFGYARAEMEGQPTSILYATAQEYERLGRERFSTEAGEALEPVRARWRRKDGTTFLGEIVGAPLRDADGAHLGFMGLVRDVTAEVAAAEALREQKAQLRTLIDHLPVVLFGLDREGRFTTSAGRGLDALGLRPNELTGQRVFDVYAGHDAMLADLRRGLRGEPVALTVEIEGVVFDLRTTPLLDASGRPDGLIGVATDVTARARAEEEARRARRQAEASAQTKGAFLAAMSHEIRTPLTGIIGFADVLAEVAEGEAHTYAEIIRKSGHRLLETINSVLHLARLDADEVPIRPAATDVGATVQEVADLLRPLAEQKGLAFHVEAPAVPLRTDGSALHRVATNLLGNAIKFTDEGQVAVRVREAGGGAILTVEDTGRGMDPSFLPHLFEPFRREDDRPGLPAGTGLGLTITARLVDLLGGTLSVDSAVGEGTTFTLRLPPAPADEPLTEAPVEEPLFE